MNAVIVLEVGSRDTILGEDAIKNLFALPTMTEPPSVDWAEEDGVEIDEITATQVEEQKVAIPMYSRGRNVFPDLLDNRTIRLFAGGIQFGDFRPVSVENVQKWAGGWSAVLVCSRSEKPAPTDNVRWESGLTILADVASAPIWVSPENKGIASVEDETGRYYFAGSRPYKAKYSLEVPVLIKAPTLQDLWTARNKLLSRLTARGLRAIPRFDGDTLPVSGVYSTSTSRDVSADNDGYRWTIDITFTITKL